MQRERPTKECARPDCTKLCVKRYGENARDWSDRRYCSRECVDWAPPSPDRPCARDGCDQIVRRRKNEGRAAFDARSYCGKQCGAIVGRATPRLTKPCRRHQCTGFVTQKFGESGAAFKRRAYCGSDCHQLDRPGPQRPPPKPCGHEGCPSILTQRPRESPSHFARRTFCSLSCSNAVKHPPIQRLSKPCAIEGCPGLVVQASKEGAGKFAMKKYCCLACRTLGQARAMVAGKPPRPKSPPKQSGAVADRLHKPCKAAGCPNELTQKSGESPSHFAARAYCGPECRKTSMQGRAHLARLAVVRAARKPKPAPVRRKGNVQWAETRFAPAVGDAERAANVLRREAPVWPERVEKPGSEMWIVWGRRMAADEMIEMASRRRAA